MCLDDSDDFDLAELVSPSSRLSATLIIRVSVLQLLYHPVVLISHHMNSGWIYVFVMFLEKAIAAAAPTLVSTCSHIMLVSLNCLQEEGDVLDLHAFDDFVEDIEERSDIKSVSHPTVNKSVCQHAAAQPVKKTIVSPQLGARNNEFDITTCEK